MLSPQVPLRLLSEFTRADFPEDESSIDGRKSAVEKALKNCQIVRDVGTDQMNKPLDPDLLEDVRSMRAVALMAIPAAEAALRADALEDFNLREREFRSHYDNLIRSVQNFLWDAGPVSQRCLWPLVGDLM